MRVTDIPALTLLAAPVWLVLGVGVAVVCVKGARRLQAGEDPGWQTSIVAWVVSATVLWLPMVMMARTVVALALGAAYAALASFPFLGASAVLNRASVAPRGVRHRVWLAAATGAGGIIATLGAAAVLGYALGFEMYP